MKHSLLWRLRRNGVLYLLGALLLVLGIPLYQLVTLVPAGYNEALSASGLDRTGAYLAWIHGHALQFLVYRVLLIIAFSLLLSFPFTLFRIIIAQELMDQQEQEESKAEEEGEADEDTPPQEAVVSEERDAEMEAMPTDAWRGKGFAVLAAWSGLLGLLIYVAGTLASTVYLFFTSSSFAGHTAAPSGFAGWSATFAIITNTIGIGLLALSTLFFGAIIARSGPRLWPWIWTAFGYVALAVAALFSGSAVAVASVPGNQAALTSPAILLFGLWILWFGSMLVRLRPEP